MVKVIALVRGYFGGKIIEAGEPFGVPAEIWNDKKLRPKWAREPGAADAYAEVEEAGDGSEGVVTANPKGKGKGKAKPVTVKAPEAKPFEDAPAPVRAKSEINDALGTTQPDWLAPGGAPQAVTD